MALRKPLFMSTEGFSEEMAATDTAAFGGLTLSGNIAMGTNRITGLGNASGAQDAVTLSQLEAAVISGGTVKELLFDQGQLNNAQGINALEVLTFANQPIVGDTVIFTNGTLTRTYSFVANIAGESAATDVSIETDAATAMQRLVTRATADAGNTAWDLVFRATEHPDINAAGVIMVTEKATAAGASPSRIYGVWTTQADVEVVEFATGATPTVDLDYSDETVVTLPSSDPGAGRFGLRKQQSALAAGEIHFVRTNDSQYAWDDDTSTWNVLSGSGAIPDATSASGGGIKGKVTADSDKGLTITSGIMEVHLNGTTLAVGASGLSVQGLPSLFEINGAAVSVNVTAANLSTLTGGTSTTLHSHANDHVRSHDIESTSDHTLTGASVGEVLRASGATTFAFAQLSHSDLGGVGANDHHNRSHAITSGSDHTESGLTAGQVLTALTPTTFGWAAPAAAEEAKKVENTYTTATDTTANGDAVYWNGNNTLGLARADTDAKARVVGVVRTGAGAAPTSVDMVSHGPCAGVLSGATANTPYYLQATGGIGTSLPGAGNRVIRMGIALNGSDLWVEVVDYGKKAA